MPDWRRRDGSWWPCFLPWIGVEVWGDEDALFLGLSVRKRWRVLSVEWFHRGFTIAAWEAHGRIPDRLSWPMAAAIILVASPLLGVLTAYLTVLLTGLAR